MKKTKKPTPPTVPDWPNAVWKAIACPLCQTPLLRADTGWVCVRAMCHTKIILDYQYLELLDKQLPKDGTKQEIDRKSKEVISGRAVQLRRALAKLKQLSKHQIIPQVM
jgi:hypothetical protein